VSANHSIACLYTVLCWPRENARLWNICMRAGSATSAALPRYIGDNAIAMIRDIQLLSDSVSLRRPGVVRAVTAAAVGMRACDDGFSRGCVALRERLHSAGVDVARGVYGDEIDLVEASPMSRNISRWLYPLAMLL